MSKVDDCRKEVRRLIKAVTFAKPEKRYNLMIATYGKLAEFERLLTREPTKEELDKMLENTS